MQRMMFCAAALALTGLGLSVATAARTALSPAAARGRQVFIADGCSQCHGTTGQGTVAPKIAPNPLPLQIFTLQLRNPRGIMPVYTSAIMPDEKIADIYAYLSSIPKIKAAAEIPLLNQ
jgi:ubiquinol-cytochrome c reductase cytochrome c subunit